MTRFQINEMRRFYERRPRKSSGKEIHIQFNFIKILSNGQGNANEERNRLLRGGRIVPMRKDLLPNGQDSSWALCTPRQQPDEIEPKHWIPVGSQLRLPGPDGRRFSKGLNRPPSSSSRHRQDDETQEVSPGEGRPAEAGSKAPGGFAAPHVPALS